MSVYSLHAFILKFLILIKENIHTSSLCMKYGKLGQTGSSHSTKVAHAWRQQHFSLSSSRMDRQNDANEIGLETVCGTVVEYDGGVGPSGKAFPSKTITSFYFFRCSLPDGKGPPSSFSPSSFSFFLFFTKTCIKLFMNGWKAHKCKHNEVIE